MNEFNNKIVLVTGGNSGIGKDCAEKFAASGANVIISARDSKKAQDVIDNIRSQGGSVEFLPADLSNNKEITELFSIIHDKYNTLDIAVNCAGIEGKSFTRLHEYPENIWDEVLQVNLKAVWLSMKYEIGMMLANKSGAIINISSLAGLKASLTAGAAYTASKHGVIGLTRSAAKEYARDSIRVNCICPTIIKTPMCVAVLGEQADKLASQHHPIGRIGYPSDISELVLFLSSKNSEFITGVYIPVDGGVMA